MELRKPSPPCEKHWQSSQHKSALKTELSKVINRWNSHEESTMQTTQPEQPTTHHNVTTNVTRWREKNGIADLEKAKHYIELLIELESRK